MRIRIVLLAALAAASLCLACGSGEAPDPQTSAPSAAPSRAADSAPSAPVASSAGTADEAKQIFATRCFTCHGSEGRGDGPGSAALTPKPRNFHDVTWQTSVNDEHLATIVKFGGAAVGRSPAMPGNPDLISKPEVVAALVAHIRSLADPQ
jgi:mono/diheme cytochrome c family protein